MKDKFVNVAVAALYVCAMAVLAICMAYCIRFALASTPLGCVAWVLFCIVLATAVVVLGMTMHDYVRY